MCWLRRLPDTPLEVRVRNRCARQNLSSSVASGLFHRCPPTPCTSSQALTLINPVVARLGWCLQPPTPATTADVYLPYDSISAFNSMVVWCTLIEHQCPLLPAGGLNDFRRLQTPGDPGVNIRLLELLLRTTFSPFPDSFPRTREYCLVAMSPGVNIHFHVSIY